MQAKGLLYKSGGVARRIAASHHKSVAGLRGVLPGRSGCVAGSLAFFAGETIKAFDRHPGFFTRSLAVRDVRRVRFRFGGIARS